jgi:hypothetical protein
MRVACWTTHGTSAVIGGLLIAALATPARPVLGQASSDGFSARLWAGAVGRYVLKDNDTFAAPGFGTVGLKVNGSAFGFGADGEYKFDRWIGLDGAIGYSRLNVQYTTTNAPGTTSTQPFGIVPVLLSLNIHFVSTQRVDIWAGPQIGYVMFPDNLSYASNGGSTFTYTSTNVFSKKGVSVGADIALRRTLLLNVAGRWQDADADANGHLTIDPTFVTVGLTWKY